MLERHFREKAMKWSYCISMIVALGLAGRLEAGTSTKAAAAPRATPAAPTNLVVQPGSHTSVYLFWDDNASDETEYRIEMRTLNTPYREVIKAVDANGILPGLESGTVYIFRIRAFNDAGFSAYSNEAAGTPLTAPSPCTPGPQTLCLLGGVYAVQAHWRTPQGQLGAGNALPLTSDTGAFWFFSPDNVEMVVKVLDGCALSRTYWVFAGGLTNVEVVWTVTDSRVGVPNAYLNPAGAAFLPLQDTAAFRGCP
jgi:Fibronectin type III domain